MTQWPRTRSAAWLVLCSLLVPIWAVAGLAMGVAAGSNQDAVDAANAQRRFDAAYTQCMLAKGNGAPRVVYQRAQPVYVPAPSAVPPDYAEPGVPPDYVPPGR